MTPQEKLKDIEDELRDWELSVEEYAWLISRVKELEKALEFYADMNNRVPGTSEWDIEVQKTIQGFSIGMANLQEEMTGQKGKMIVWNKPSKLETDCGELARKALAGEE